MKNVLHELFLEQDTKISGLERYRSMSKESKPIVKDIDEEFD